jgi:hypothetical protein
MVFRGEFSKKLYFMDRIEGPVNGENVYFNIKMVNYGPKLNVRFPEGPVGGLHFNAIKSNYSARSWREEVTINQMMMKFALY